MRSALVAVAAAASALVTGPPTVAEPAGDVIPAVAERIVQLGDGRGFAGLRTDYPRRAISVLWSGPVPADVLRYADSAPDGVEVTVRTGAKYSRAEADAARVALQETVPGIVSTSIRADGGGLEIGVSGSAPVAASVAGIDVRVRYGVPAPAGYSRTNDSAPWRGGARIVTGAGSTCSTGFAVIKSGTGRLLSARHCDEEANGGVYDGAGDLISGGGAAVSAIAGVDSLLIDPVASPATTPRIYRGAYNSNSYSTVKNYASNWPGDPVCTSGASTGEHCGTVYDDSENVNVNGVWVNVIQVSAPAGGIMAGEGDSGGAVFRKLSNGVQARGIVLGPDLAYPQTTACGTVNPDIDGIRCSRYLNYVPISTILNSWGATLEVG